MIVCYFSCGAASAIAAKLAINKYGIYWGYEFEKWNCNRVGMDFDYFVNGCVVRKNVKND